MRIGVLGGGAAGFFSAITAKEENRSNEVIILERSNKFLSKVKISGGGRCNVTNACFDIQDLATHYPRGQHFLKKAFHQFDAKSSMEWFERRGVALRIYPDNCVFPKSNSSQSIIDCFLNQCVDLGIGLKEGFHALSIERIGKEWNISSGDEILVFDKLIVAIGGQPKRSGLNWLENLGLEIIDPVPSLFTFNMPNNPVRELMGTVNDPTTIRIEGTKLIASGPLLITHWGMSGPAILLLSAWGARELYERNYQFSILVNWLNDSREDVVKFEIEKFKKSFPEKKVCQYKPYSLTIRLWQFLVLKAGLSTQLTWKDLSGKSMNRLVNTLVNDRYEVSGKTTFKEEFVTAGGVSLKEIDVKTMESRKFPGLFFAGEVMDIDGVTGGFNFQAAWTTGHIAGINASKRNQSITLSE